MNDQQFIIFTDFFASLIVKELITFTKLFNSCLHWLIVVSFLWWIFRSVYCWILTSELRRTTWTDNMFLSSRETIFCMLALESRLLWKLLPDHPDACEDGTKLLSTLQEIWCWKLKKINVSSPFFNKITLLPPLQTNFCC